MDPSTPRKSQAWSHVRTVMGVELGGSMGLAGHQSRTRIIEQVTHVLLQPLYMYTRVCAHAHLLTEHTHTCMHAHKILLHTVLGPAILGNFFICFSVLKRMRKMHSYECS